MSEGNPNRVNILLVDDRAENLTALEAILKHPDYRLLTARSGDEALRIALRETLAVILLDVVMPQMSGLEVAAYLKKVDRTRNIPIIFLTGVATDVRQIYQAYEVGAVDYLVKPLDMEVVRRKVAVFVDLVQQREEIARQARRLLEVERRDHELQVAELRVASDRRYRKLVEGIYHAMAWTADREGKLVFVSRQAPRILGLPIEEFLRPDFWKQHSHPKDYPIIDESFRRVTSDKRDIGFEHRMLTGDGTVRWFHTGVSCEVNADGADELHGISTEVTDLKRSEEIQSLLADVGSILSSSLDYRLTLPQVAERIVPMLGDWCLIDEVVDATVGRRLAAHHADPVLNACVQELGHRPVIAAGDHDETLDLARLREPVLHAEVQDIPWLAAAIGAARVDRLERLQPRSCMFVPIRARERNLGVATILSCGTRQLSAMELELAQQVFRRVALAVDNSKLFDETRRATRAREDLLAIVSHDLRNPLGAIVTSAQVLEKHEPEAASQRTQKLVQTIVRSAERMNRLISDLLDFSMLESGQVALDRTPVDVRDVIHESIETFLPMASEKGLRLEEIAPDETRVCCDRGRILQVLLNLIGNAIKFTPASGSVLVKAQIVGNEVQFSVCDTGRGIAEDALSRVWDRYWHAKEGGGYGLGLSIAKGFVEAHGGRIWAKSRIGAGTSVYFTLPLADEHGSEADAPG